jgi:hypothetical protein
MKTANWFFSIVLIVLLTIGFLVACSPESQGDIEQGQQAQAVSSISKNQPVPDLGGFSLERKIVIETYLARNKAITTYSYMITMSGQLIEICPSIGYPIPYSTELTNPQVLTYSSAGGYRVDGTVANPEPNGLYPPSDAAATLVQCVNDDGSVSPVYIEWYVESFPFRIKSDVQLERIGEPSFTVDLSKP